MAYITSIKDFSSNRPHSKQILLICGFIGKIWQMKRLINLLNKNGYNVRAIDYTTDVLTKGNPQMFLDLVNEVHHEAIRLKKEVHQQILLIGMSMGALISYYIIRHDERFPKAMMITRGDMAKAVRRSQGRKTWPQNYKELANFWKAINLYSDPKKHKKFSGVMVLPIAGKLIDPDDVRNEIKIQNKAGNHVHLIERRFFGHIETYSLKQSFSRKEYWSISKC